MSTFIAGFDGHTCCNCGLPRDAHLRSYGPDDAAPRQGGPLPALRVVCLQGQSACAPAAAPADAAALAGELLGLIERDRWWLGPVVLGLGHCRACGYDEGGGHHPACRYAGLAQQIGRLAAAD